MICLIVLSAAGYDDLGLISLADDLSRLTVDLPMDVRLATLDSLVIALEVEAAPPDSLRRWIAAHYAGSALMKHRVWALEMYGEDAPDRDAPTALLDQALRYTHTFNPWDANRHFARLTRLHPQLAIGHRNWGLHLMQRGSHILDAELLREAESHFTRAAHCDDAGYADWLGMAAAMVAHGDRSGLPQVVARLRELEPDARPTLLYGAIADLDLGMDQSAELQFERVIDDLGTTTRQRFRELGEFLRSVMPLRLEDSAIAAPPTPGILQWYRRMVECELLFGDRRAQTSGWQTAVGEAWLLFGRPLDHIYFPPFYWNKGRRPDLEVITALMPRLDGKRDMLSRAIAEINAADGFWIWVIQVGDDEYPYVFQKGAAFATWTHAAASSQEILRPLQNTVPMNLQRTEEQIVTADLRVRHASFRAADGRSLLECNFAIALEQIANADELQCVWTVRDQGDGRSVVDQRTPLRELSARHQLLEFLRPGNAPGDARLGRLAAILPEGRYLSRVTIETPTGSVVAGSDEIYRAFTASSGFGMSDLLLADSFDRTVADSDDSDFVRHAVRVIPHPEYQVFPWRDEVQVYYEIYDAQVDELGRVHLDVLYEVFELERFNPLDVGRSTETQGALMKIRFVDERTGRSPTGVTVRGTALPLQELPSGHYVLAVTVSDRLARVESSRSLRFAR